MLVLVGLAIAVKASAEAAATVAYDKVASSRKRRDLGPELKETLARAAEEALASATGWGGSPLALRQVPRTS